MNENIFHVALRTYGPCCIPPSPPPFSKVVHSVPWAGEDPVSSPLIKNGKNIRKSRGRLEGDVNGRLRELAEVGREGDIFLEQLDLTPGVSGK
jgi:hypothetical protein